MLRFIDYESRPRARGGIASIGEVLCTVSPVGRALTRSGLVLFNAPFGVECTIFFALPTLPAVFVGMRVE